MAKRTTAKEYIYIGHYTDIDGLYIVKIGATNDPTKRAKAHDYYYKHKAKSHPMSTTEKFIMDWVHPVAMYNARRYEDSNRTRLKAEGWGVHVNADRFAFTEKPEAVTVIIKKSYTVKFK